MRKKVYKTVGLEETLLVMGLRACGLKTVEIARALGVDRRSVARRLREVRAAAAKEPELWPRLVDSLFSSEPYWKKLSELLKSSGVEG